MTKEEMNKMVDTIFHALNYKYMDKIEKNLSMDNLHSTMISLLSEYEIAETENEISINSIIRLIDKTSDNIVIQCFIWKYLSQLTNL